MTAEWRPVSDTVCNWIFTGMKLYFRINVTLCYVVTQFFVKSISKKADISKIEIFQYYLAQSIGKADTCCLGAVPVYCVVLRK